MGYSDKASSIRKSTQKLQEYIDPNKISYKRAYEWSKIKKFKPAMCVMSNFPIDEINNFYINKNNKRWGELLKLSKLKDEEEIGAFFKLSYSFRKSHFLLNFSKGFGCIITCFFCIFLNHTVNVCFIFTQSGKFILYRF